MKETTNYKLKKPNENDFFDLENHFNHNVDIIDAALKENKDIAESKAPAEHDHNIEDIKNFKADATSVDYDNKASGLNATKVQGAIDEVNEKANANETSISEIQQELSGSRASLITSSNQIRNLLVGGAS